MHKFNFDGFISYDDPGFQDIVSSLKTATDHADAAYNKFHSYMTAYIALLHLNANFLMMRDKAGLADFVRSRIGGDLASSGALPSDEIETAIDAQIGEIVKSINNAAKNIEGKKPKYEYAYNMPYDASDARDYDIYLTIAESKAKSIAKGMTTFLEGTLVPALKVEQARAQQLLTVLAKVDGGSGSAAIAGDPLDHTDAFLQSVAVCDQDTQKNHAGLVEFGHYVKEALEKRPNVTREDVIAAFEVTATTLPSHSTLLAFWDTLIGLSNWSRTANFVTVKNRAGFQMRARAVYVDGPQPKATDWTDKYIIGDDRDIDLRKTSAQTGQLFQIEVDAELGRTARSSVFFMSTLNVAETVTIEVSGATLTYSIDVT